MLTSLVSPGWPVGLFDQVITARRPDDLNVLHSVEHGKFSNGHPVTPEFVGVNDVWNVIVDQASFEEGLRGFGVPVGLQENVEHRTGFIDGPPQPVFFARHIDTHLIQEPPATPPGFPVAQLLGEEWGEFDVPLAQSLVTDHYAALVEQFLNIALTQWETVVEPEGVLDDAQWKTVSVGLAVSHRELAYCG